jgi:hypothetical protein
MTNKQPQREDYELAAKAAGLDICIASDFDTLHGDLPFITESFKQWSPYHDDGDSRRLQIAILASLSFLGDALYAVADGGFEEIELYANHNGDKAAAARAAVFWLAVEIGRNTK